MTNQLVGATIIEALDLDPPPIALAFVDQPPIGIDTVQADLPSSCAFWRKAEQEVFSPLQKLTSTARSELW